MVVRRLAHVLVLILVVAAVGATGMAATGATDALPTITGDVEYGRAVRYDGTEQVLLADLYTPPGVASAPRPVLLWIHGGGFMGGSKNEPGDEAIAGLFAADGYQIVSIDYRLRPIATLNDAFLAAADAQADAQTSVQWIRAHADELGVDPGRIVAAGFSAGGMTAVHTAYRTFGDLGSGPAGVPATVSAGVSLSGFGVLPADLAGAANVPTLFVHGLADPLIRFDLAGDSCKKLVAAGKDCELVGFPDGHGVLRYQDPTHRYTTDWLRRHGLAPAL